MLVGYIAGAVTKYLGLIERPAVSYGYDRVRFTKSVFIGDTLTVHYRIARADGEPHSASRPRKWSRNASQKPRCATISSVPRASL